MRGEIDDRLNWPKTGCYPLVPFSNKIRNASFQFEGAGVQLPPHPACAPDTVHGFAQQRPWSLELHGQDCATMRYVHAPDAWPWSFAAEQDVRLDRDGLTVRMSVHNRDRAPMPVGFGLHPYFVIRPGDRIRFDADGEWEQDERGCGTKLRRLSTGERRFDERHGTAGVTRYFADWSGVATIERADGAAIVVRAEAPFNHLVFHTPQGGAYACLEPVSHVADAFNLAASGVGETGFRALAPGETTSGSVRIELQ